MQTPPGPGEGGIDSAAQNAALKEGMKGPPPTAPQNKGSMSWCRCKKALETTPDHTQLGISWGKETKILENHVVREPRRTLHNRSTG